MFRYLAFIPSIPVLFAVFYLAVTPARAERVTLTYKGLGVSANLQLADGKSLKDGVALITHGTMGYGGMEVIATMQDLLKERGMSSLAITLSLGLDNRKGMYDCAVTHTHKYTDALDEIGFWLGWLKDRGAGPVILIGHSLGGNQTARFAAERDDPIISRVVLVAPARYNMKKVAAAYRKRYKTDLMPIYDKAAKLVKAGKGGTVMKGVGFLYCRNANVTASSFESYYKDDIRKDTPSILSRIKKPVLVIVGSADRVVRGLPEAVRKSGSSAKLVVVEDAGHFFHDLFADDMADAIAKFANSSRR
jgi:pimeloyl-ACP methyl ester carboxylesterase